MFVVNSYVFIIIISVIIILSYFYSLISRRTNIPSVLLLIGTGILIKQGMIFFESPRVDLFPALEILGIVGLIMIVLEAALDLELTKQKLPLILKSFSVALAGLAASMLTTSMVIFYFLDMSRLESILYSIPLAIMSSAIVIPSITNVSPDKKEFLVYESTLSDIMGIMVFYMLLGSIGIQSTASIALNITGNVLFTILISVVTSYVLIFVFQNLRAEVKLFLLISVLLLLYSIGKLLHLSSLLLILIFGLILNNNHLFIRGILKKWYKKEAIRAILKDFRIVTFESAFVVRTFFFVIFGISISLSALINFRIFIISALIITLIYLVRYLILKIFLRKDIMPELFVAPRGLITILLYFSIPEEYHVEEFDSGILLYVILISSIVMSFSLMTSKKKDMFEPLFTEGEEEPPSEAGDEEIEK